LDKLLYPDYSEGRRPYCVTGDDIAQIDDRHYTALRGSEALDPLLQTLRTGTEFARSYAATVLGAIKERQAFPLVIPALFDASSSVRPSGTKGLWFFRDRSALPALIQALHDPNKEVICSAANTLGWIGDRKAVEPLMAIYATAKWQIQSAVVHALGEIAAPESLELVKGALGHNVRRVRDAAKSALSRYYLKRRENPPS